MWVGIGGIDWVDTYTPQPGLEQVGIAAQANSKTDKSPIYVGFWQMNPNGKINETGWLTSNGKKYTANGGVIDIKAGETISAAVYAPNDGPYTEPKDFTLILTVNGTAYHVFEPLYKGLNKPGSTAEVITEKLGSGGLLATNPSAVKYVEGYIYTAPKVGPDGPQGINGHAVTMQNPKDLVILEKVSAATPVPDSYPTLDQFTTTFTGRW